MSDDDTGSKKRPRLEVAIDHESPLPASDNLVGVIGTGTSTCTCTVVVADVPAARQVEEPLEQQQYQQQHQENQWDDLDVQEENQQGQQVQQEQKSKVEQNEIDDIKNAISKIDGTISKIEKDIEKSNQDMEEINNQISELQDRIKMAEDALATSPTNQGLETLFQTFPFMESVIDKRKLPDEQEDALRTYINKQRDIIEERYKRIHDKEGGIHTDKMSLASLRAQQAAHVQRLLEKERLLTVKQSDLESGLLHVQDTLRLQFRDRGPTNIGMMEHYIDHNDNKKRRLKRNFETWESCQELIDAWPLIRLDTSSPEFLKGLVSKIKFLDHKLLTNAVQRFNIKHDVGTTTHLGEVALMELVYIPFSILFIAAAAGGLEGENYKRNQNVSASLSVLCKVNEEDPCGVSKKITILPNAAVTLPQGWDVFGMMEVKCPEPYNPREPNHHDIDKCTMMTAASAIVFSQCIDDKRRNEIAIPFVIGTGTMCSLYVTTMCDGFPSIRVLNYPGGDRSDWQCIKPQLGSGRVKCFVALAVLLDKIKGLFDDEARAKYEKGLAQRTPNLLNLPLESFRSMNAKESSQNDKSHNTCSNANPSSDEYGSSKEQSAKTAAACGGRFSNVEYPWIGSMWKHQTESPFYFKAHSTLSTNGTTSKDVFLKVWNVEDVDRDSVISEWKNYRHAFISGVPVAGPVFDEIATSTGSCGSEYLVFAVEYIHEDVIQNAKNFLNYCVCLIEAVTKLHKKAGLLHCDLKPDNVCWSKGVVRLIDFGHSQQIRFAGWSRGTEGFEAPEILHGMQCSTKTDAFSVGATLLYVLQKKMISKIQQDPTCRILHDIALRLTDRDPNKRWSLNEALHKIRRMKQNEGSPPMSG